VRFEVVGQWEGQVAIMVMFSSDGGWYSGVVSLKIKSVFARIRSVYHGFRSNFW